MSNPYFIRLINQASPLIFSNTCCQKVLHTDFSLAVSLEPFPEQPAEPRWQEQVPSIHHKLCALCYEWKHLLTIPASLVFEPNKSRVLGVASLPWQGSTFRRNDKSRTGKRATRGSSAVTEKQEVKPILRMSSCSVSLDAVSFVWSQIKAQTLWVS